MGTVFTSIGFPAKYSVKFEHAFIYRNQFAEKCFVLETNVVSDSFKFKSENL